MRSSGASPVIHSARGHLDLDPLPLPVLPAGLAVGPARGVVDVDVRRLHGPALRGRERACQLDLPGHRLGIVAHGLLGGLPGVDGGDHHLLPFGPRGSTVPGRHIAYWMTSSARASTDGGIVRPRAFAALRLIIRSNLVGCSTGRSAGLAPLRILST